MATKIKHPSTKETYQKPTSTVDDSIPLLHILSHILQEHQTLKTSGNRIRNQLNNT